MSGFDESACRNPAIVGSLQEILGGIVGILANVEHFATVTVKAVKIDGNVNVDNVALFQLSVVGDADPSVLAKDLYRYNIQRWIDLCIQKHSLSNGTYPWQITSFTEVQQDFGKP